MNRRSFLTSLLTAIGGAAIAPRLKFDVSPQTGCISISDINDLFRQSEAAIGEAIINKRMRSSNAYWGKISNAGRFPSNKGSVIRETHEP